MNLNRFLIGLYAYIDKFCAMCVCVCAFQKLWIIFDRMLSIKSNQFQSLSLSLLVTMCLNLLNDSVGGSDS